MWLIHHNPIREEGVPENIEPGLEFETTDLPLQAPPCGEESSEVDVSGC